MIRIGVAELRDDLDELLQRVRDEGETLEITLHGEPIARVVPAQVAAPEPHQPPSPEEVAKMMAELEQFAREVSAHWKDDLDAVEAVREQRRDL